jgi:ribosomal protein S4
MSTNDDAEKTPSPLTSKERYKLWYTKLKEDPERHAAFKEKKRTFAREYMRKRLLDPINKAKALESVKQFRARLKGAEIIQT